MSEIRPVRLPDCFYLPRYSRCGFEIRDVMPCSAALAYVTDGVRIGVHFRSGRVEWFLQPSDGSLRADRYRMNFQALPGDVVIDREPCDLVQAIWRDNAEVWSELAALAPGS